MTDDAGNGDIPADGVATTFDFSRFRARRIRQRLLALLDALIVAIQQRDGRAVFAVLDSSEACRWFPPTVREEALAIAILPASTVRVPARLYHFYHIVTQLGDEPVEHEGDPLLPVTVPDDPGDGPPREIVFPDRRPPRGGPRSGPDRRRSSSR